VYPRPSTKIPALPTLRSSQLSILAAAALFSTGGAVIKASSMSAGQIAGFRSGIAAVVLFVLVPAARRRWTWRMLLVASTHAATFLLFVHANRLTTAANTVFLQGTAPLWILLLSPRLLGEKPARRDLPFVVAIGIGAVPFFLGLQTSFETAPDPLRGNVLAAVAGLSWALTLIGLRWLRTSSEGDADPTMATVVCGNTLVLLFSLPSVWPVQAAGALDWGLVIFLGTVQVAVAYLLLVRGLARVPAFEASLFILAEPVLSVLLTLAVHGEVPSLWSLLGGAVILASTTVRTWAQGHREASTT